jgi:protein-tyrosine phosphatase
MAITDLHSHLIPGVDDGAQHPAEAHAGLQALRDEGVAALVCTPHLDGSLTLQPAALERRLAEIDAGWETLRAIAREATPELELHRAVELKLDLPEPDLTDPRLRVGGGPFVMVEFPYMTVPPFSAHVLSGIRMQGWCPVLVHPERYAGLDPKLELAREWRRVGAYLQVNGGSILGRYGPEARAWALALLEQGLVDYLASDFHSRGRPRIQEYRAALLELGGTEQAGLLLETNPARLLAGEPPHPVPPLQARRGLMERLRKVFR